MNEQVLSKQLVTRTQARPEAELKLESDPGPWLYFAAPVSFAVTLALLCWLSLTSF
jgi:hypothetical protein